MSGDSLRRERREIILLLIVLALPALVFWGVTLEAVSTRSRPALLVAGIGALASTLGYVCLAWRTRSRRRSLRGAAAPAPAPDLAAASIPHQPTRRAPVIHRGP